MFLAADVAGKRDTGEGAKAAATAKAARQRIADFSPEMSTALQSNPALRPLWLLFIVCFF
jgi:hypothetical protein